MDQPCDETQEPTRRFNQEQYDMLFRCSEKQDMTEWNDWRKANPKVEILLKGACLTWAHLEGTELTGAHLEGADLRWAHLEGADLRWAHLENAVLTGAHLEGAFLGLAHLENAVLTGAHLEGTKLAEAHLENAYLTWAHLEGTKLAGAHLENADLTWAHLEGADLAGAHLESADLTWAHLEGADLCNVHLESTNVRGAIVDEKTLLLNCTVDRDTDFREVGLDSMRIDVGTKQLLEYNIRRKNWEDWYQEHSILKWFVRLFWWISDYGMSVARLTAIFLGLATIFALIYYLWGKIHHPGILQNLFEITTSDGKTLQTDWPFLRALYFSITTMTTLGFGDIHADIQSKMGHILVILQVLSGYVLLGALITRFSILFTAGGPPGKFTPKWPEILSRIPTRNTLRLLHERED